MEKIRWTLRTFTELSASEWYDIARVRQDVFILEQACLFGDLDGRDQVAMHLCARTDDGTLAAYARIFHAGVLYDAASIGRILTAGAYRGKGLGRELVSQALRYLDRHQPGVTVRISAQQHLEAFYRSFGFATISEPYIEDGIWHIDMIRWPG